jgi:hypothetical protein
VKMDKLLNLQGFTEWWKEHNMGFV